MSCRECVLLSDLTFIDITAKILNKNLTNVTICLSLPLSASLYPPLSTSLLHLIVYLSICISIAPSLSSYLPLCPHLSLSSSTWVSSSPPFALSLSPLSPSLLLKRNWITHCQFNQKLHSSFLIIHSHTDLISHLLSPHSFVITLIENINSWKIKMSFFLLVVNWNLVSSEFWDEKQIRFWLTSWIF